MSALLEEPQLGAPPTEPPAPSPPAPDPDGEWRVHKTTNKLFIPRKGSSGIIYRHGNESIAEARARDDAGPKDKPPKPKAKPKGKLPPAPTEVSLQQLEHELAEAFAAPGYLAAANGDQYMADHFVKEGPRLARHLVTSAKYNPWLRQKLEAAATGQNDMLINLIMSMGLAGALVSYAVVPIVYYLDPPFLSRAREMYRIPQRDSQEPGIHAVSPESTEAPEGAAAAAAA